ncbi:MAG: T9SS C-terminal target domain-containing protein [Bacteroidetes bacterium]|nr:MAG: T9SS C-terminal target domain-containing protein [Bacteroidota bacterium]REJ99689.1 MAG: T9SS C-terminal target domain-containing protein [Bacteroidota bacterium]REK33922.1 MAG: T9SS C-terminal target domain-containing protein [Bacteroidota bacterium]REK47688.1 MAG: T9SS C-terminal target domain-containing protein [Bacteroidota bacterium]
MKHSYFRILILCLFLTTFSYAQTPVLRGMYVSKFSQILGNTVKEDSLLRYAQDSSFNYMALYDLHNISLSNSTNANKMAAFIKRAKNFGVTHIGATGESYSSFSGRIVPYNNSRADANEKFNVFNLEFEFWISSSVNPGGYYCTQYLIPNNCPCDTSGAFRFFIDQLRRIDSVGNIQNAISETYVGWFNQGQAQQIANNVDRILLHAYRTSNSSVYSYSKTRLSYFASVNRTVEVAPIFSAEPDFMGPWLNSNPQIAAYNKYMTDFNADNNSWKQHINISGYQWFHYGYMPKNYTAAPAPIVALVNAAGPTTFCNGGSVTLTASGGSNYLWSNGATSASITVSTSGSYNCEVSSGSASATSNTVTVTVNNLPTATITAGGSTQSGIILSSNSTAGSGSIASYQWMNDGVNISGATSSTFTPSVSGNYSLRVSNSGGCSSTSTAMSVTVASISASGNTDICQGETVTLTAGGGTSYLWSNGETGSSITVNTSGSYSCEVFNSGSSATTTGINVNVNNLPVSSFVAGTNTSNGVSLNSNSSAGSGTIIAYQWMLDGSMIPGATSQIYLATSSGNYSLEVTNSGGCKNMSSIQSITVNPSSCNLTVPSGLTSFVLSTSSVLIKWNSLPQADSVIIRYSRDGSGVYQYVRLPYSSVNTYQINGLIANAKYSWRVKTVCGYVSSAYSAKNSFKTSNRNTASVVNINKISDDYLNMDQERELVAYPNPSKGGVIYFSFLVDEEQTGRLSLMDMTGRTVINNPVQLIEGDNNIHFETNSLPSGIYFATILMGEQKIMKKIIVQNN